MLTYFNIFLTNKKNKFCKLLTRIVTVINFITITLSKWYGPCSIQSCKLLIDYNKLIYKIKTKLYFGNQTVSLESYLWIRTPGNTSISLKFLIVLRALRYTRALRVLKDFLIFWGYWGSRVRIQGYDSRDTVLDPCLSYWTFY